MASVEQANKTRRARNSKSKKAVVFDEGALDGNSDQETSKKKKPTKKNGRKKATADLNDASMLNRVKTKNKLIGDIEDNNIYNDDDACFDGFGATFGRTGPQFEGDEEQQREF